MQLEAHDISVTVGKKSILKNIKFCLDQHRCIGIIGPNGSGKSTLLKTFYKVIQPQCGYLTIDGKELCDINQKQCSKLLAVLPQQHSVELELTAEEVVHMGRYPYKKMFEKSTDDEWAFIRKTIHDMGLAHLAERKLTTLSGGEKQMVMIARAIVQDTPCILLDEPTNHLDIYHQMMILKTINGLNKQMIVVFHDLSLAGKYCDYLYLMKNGEVAEKGRPMDVLNRASIKHVYDLDVDIISHPRDGHPVVVL